MLNWSISSYAAELSASWQRQPKRPIAAYLGHPAVLGVLADLGVVQVGGLEPVAHAHKVAVAAEEHHHMVHLVSPDRK